MITLRTKLLIAMALMGASICYGQLDRAAILGTVTDASGGVVPNATVKVTNQGTAAELTLTTDANGNFIAPVLPIGNYQVTASAPGFKTSVRDNIALSVNDRARIDLTLSAGEVTERITVEAQAPVIDSASSTLGGVIEKQQVSNLPFNGRSLASLMGLAPGVVMLGTTQQRSMNGVSQTRLFESGSRLLVDGGDSGQVDSDIVDSAYASQARVTRASVDAIAEVRIQESSYSAEYGQSMGGVVNFITKSGTNQYHGTLFEYFRNEKLDARNYFNVAPALKPPFRLNQFGGTFGGPIKRDKIFFFVNYEGVRQRLGIFQNTFVPTQAFRNTLPAPVRAEADILPLPNGPAVATEPRLAQFIRGISNELTEDTGSGKMDYHITEKDTLTLRYNRNESFTKSWFGVGDGQFRPVPALLQTAKLAYTKTLTPTLLNEAGITFNRGVWYAGAAGSPAVLNSPIVGSIAGMAAIGPAVFDLPVANTSFTYLDTLSWTKGRHALKFGTQVVGNRDNKAISFQEIVTFLTLDSFAANAPFAISTLGQPRQGMRNKYVHFFAQDDIQATKNLTINLGVRYQYDTAPSESHGRIANFDRVTGDIDTPGSSLFDAPKLDFAPRVGFAYTPFSSKKTVLRGGFGIFHSPLVAAAAQSVPSNIPGIGQSATALNPGVGFPFPLSKLIASARNLYAFPKDWKQSYTETWNMNIQQGFGQNSVLQVGYIGNRGVHLSPFQELNRVVPGTGVRKYPQFGTITNFYDGAIADYNGLQVGFKQRLTRGMTFNVNYTWSHALDEGGVSNGPATTANQDDAHFRNEYGSADYDVRHYVELDYTYQIPGMPRVPKVIGSGWQFNGITVMRAGLPYNVVCGCDAAGIGAATARPDLITGVAVTPANFDLPKRQLNLAAFATPVGHFGSLGRNVFTGPSAYNWDFSLFKNFAVTERQQVQFRAEMFNIFNTPQFSNPGSTTSSPATFGQSLSTIPAVGGFGSNRQIQFALRYAF
ncbi:MAG: TonB-dependent receptor [Acidobacteriia bacterium]|nr:TonB-dependent receptor [Terriglobia bacterium]